MARARRARRASLAGRGQLLPLSRHHRLHLRHRRRRAEHPCRLCRAVLARPCRADGDGRLHDRAAQQGARPNPVLSGDGGPYLARHGRRHRCGGRIRRIARPPGAAGARTLPRHGDDRLRLGDLQNPAGMGLSHGGRSRHRLDPQGPRRALDAADEPVLLCGAGALRARARVPVSARALPLRDAPAGDEAQRAWGSLGRCRRVSPQGPRLHRQRRFRRVRRDLVRPPAELHQPRQFPVLQLGLLPSRGPVRRRGNPDGASDRRRGADAPPRDAARFRQVPARRLRHVHPAHAVFPAHRRHGPV